MIGCTAIMLSILDSRKEICGEFGNGYIRGCYFTNWAQYRQGTFI